MELRKDQIYELEYDAMKIKSRALSKLRKELIEADFQRMRRDEMTNNIFESMDAIYARTGKINILSTLSIARLADSRESILIDGQHRMCAYVALADKYNIDLVIPVIEFECADRDAAFQLFKLINNSNPVVLYNKRDSQIVAAGFINYIKKRYEIFSKATTNTPRFPNFNIYKIDECLRAYKLIEDNDIALCDEIIAAFDALTKYLRAQPSYAVAPWFTTDKVRADFVEYQKTTSDFPIIGIFNTNPHILFALLDYVIKNIKFTRDPLAGINTVKYRGPSTTAKKYNIWLSNDKLKKLLVELFGTTPTTTCYCCGANIDYFSTFLMSEYNPMFEYGDADTVHAVCKQCCAAAGMIPLTKYKHLLSK